MVAPALCPICQRSVAIDAVDKPFCSARCRQVDLVRWMDGKYAIVDGLQTLPEDAQPDDLDEYADG